MAAALLLCEAERQLADDRRGVNSPRRSGRSANEGLLPGWTSWGTTPRCRRATPRHVCGSPTRLRRSAHIDFTEVCDPYILMPPEPTGPAASPKDELGNYTERSAPFSSPRLRKSRARRPTSGASTSPMCAIRTPGRRRIDRAGRFPSGRRGAAEDGPTGPPTAPAWRRHSSRPDRAEYPLRAGTRPAAADPRRHGCPSAPAMQHSGPAEVTVALHR